jgi:hypothetical protein
MKQLFTALFIFAMLFSVPALIAQNISDLPSNSFPFNLGGQTMMRIDNRYEGLKGTYTLFEEFKTGTVELTKGKFSNVLINYDAYTDNLLAKNEKIADAVQMRKDMVVSFAMRDLVTGQDFLFTKHSVNGVPTFMLNLVHDTISLYCRVTKTIKKADIGGAYNTSEKRYDEFVMANTFYTDKGNGLQELQKGKKGILQAFPEYHDQLSSYLKRNKIDFNDYNQMKRVVLFINELN